MLKLHKIFITSAIVFSIAGAKAQTMDFPIEPKYYQVFDQDSLKGFDAPAARAAAISDGYLGSEFKIKMYQMQREFINNKYNLVKHVPLPNFIETQRPSPVPGCTNEDFEASTPGVISVGNQIAGWTVSGGHNAPSSASAPSSITVHYPSGWTGNNSCNLLSCCPTPPNNHSALIDCSAPGGYIDNTIGVQYPIYSIFGTGAPNANAAAANPQITGGMFGSKVLRLNSSATGDYSVQRLSKTFAVTTQNALFQFAFISVLNSGHPCCSASGFQIRLTNATANTLIACPAFSVWAPGSQCTNGVSGIDYFINQTNAPYNPSSSATQNIYNKWRINSMDLTDYIGQNITIDIIAYDCDASGHYGYMYLDAQCGPMVVSGNGTEYQADVQEVLVPTCGAAGATICAAAGLGPYSWAGPGVPINYSTPSFTNQCYISNISATYTLYMNPQGSCAPIQRVVSSTITPAPLLLASALQAQCGQTTAVITVTPSGSAASPSTLSWTPPPQTINTTTTSGTYVIPTGPAPIIVTITASDHNGCFVSANASVNPAPPIPTFTITNVSNSPSITCITPTVELLASSNYSYEGGILNYHWVSANQTFSAHNVFINNPGTYTITGFDPITNCGITQTLSIGINTFVPSASISPTLQNITCALSSIQTVTATSTQTVNVMHMFVLEPGGTVTATSHTAVLVPPMGTHTHYIVNLINGCSQAQTFTVTSNDGFPTFSVGSTPGGFTLGCNSKSLTTLNIIGAASSTLTPGAPVSYTVLGPPTTTATQTGSLSGSPNWSVNIPGTWTVITRDNTSGCETRVPVSVLANTFAPNISAIVPYPVLNCYTSSETLTGVSTNTNVNFLWSFPGTPGSSPGSTLAISANTAIVGTSSVLANYTLSITDINSTCVSYSVVPILQNLYKPIVALSGTNAITCITATVMLTNQSSSGIPNVTNGFPRNLPVVGYMWEGPPPQDIANDVSSYIAATPGVYTMTARDLNNGCLGTNTFAVADNRDFPIVNNPDQPAPFVIQCGSDTTGIRPNYTTNPSNLTFSWQWPVGAQIVGLGNEKYLKTDMPGEYVVVVTDKTNGCSVTSSGMHVISGTMVPGFNPDKTSGFAPMTVSFENTSRYEITGGSDNKNIKSAVWSFGNGTVGTYSTAATATTVFNLPGTYTVTLFVGAGQCVESISKVITVESPSELVIPNVFTPNKDGVNDVFLLKATNLSNVSMTIVDRWGEKVYELITDKGQVEWDGKNQFGKDVSEGTYFYILKATGTDGKAFDQKGTISLYR